MVVQSCHTTAIAGDVQNEEDVARTVAAAQKPIKEVTNLAMVLRVSPSTLLLLLYTHQFQNMQMLDMALSDWRVVVDTKCSSA